MRDAWKRAGISIAVALAYIAAALLGFRVAVVAEQVTTVWAPTGIAQAALLLWGLECWPAIWVAAFLVNASTHVPLWVAAGIASGNTLEAVMAAWALARFARFDCDFKRTRDAVAFIALAVAAATMISATIGAAMLCAGGVQPWGRYWDLWADWWLGDALGSLVVAPALLTAARVRLLTRRQLWETMSWVLAAMAVTEILFGPRVVHTAGQFPLAFTIFPFVIVAAVRLGQPATAFVVAGTSVVTLWNAIRGAGPFVSSPLHTRLTLVQVFMGVLGASGLLLAAAIAERRLFERRRTAVYGVGEALANSTGLEEAAPRILAAIGASLNWQVGALWIVDRQRDVLRCVAVWAGDRSIAPAFRESTEDRAFANGVGLPGRVWATGEAIWIQDVVEAPNFPRAAVARQEGLHGAFGFPIRLGSDVLGVVEFFNRSATAPDADLLAMMAAMGNDIGQFIGREAGERTMTDTQSRARAILDTAPDAIISMDHRGQITEFNAAAERMFGYQRADVVGKEMAGLIIPAPLRKPHREGLDRYLATGNGPFIDRRVETTALHADGHEFPVEISITRVPTDPPIFTGFVRDTTARIKAEQERQGLLQRELDARREAEDANRAKDEFLATLSHELRTPLNAIVGWTRMLLDGTLDEKTAHRALEIIDRNAQTQTQLVADILDVSRIVTGKLALDIRPVDLGAIIGTVLDSARPAAQAKQIRLRSTLAAHSRVIPGDPQRVQQILWNLVANAVKFTPHGGRVDVALTDGGSSSLQVKVTDSGIGIAPEFLPLVFERFRQADSSSTRQHGGLGLGLAIVRHLVELHGGTIRAESEGAGKGATFILELPKLVDDHGAERRVAPLPDRKSQSLARPLSGCRVLVVEDEHDALELLAEVLKRSGAIVETATSVSQARAALERSRPDVLVSDIGFAGEDGYALIREVRQREDAANPHLPAAAVTAFVGPDDRARALDAGFDRHLAKPVDAGILVETVLALWTRRPRDSA